MNTIVFKDKEHEKFFYSTLSKITSPDIYRIVFFYLMGLTSETRDHICSLYDFNLNCITPDYDDRSWQTSTSLRVCNMAFNLYGGYFDENYAGTYTPSYLFCCSLAEYFIMALRMLLAHIPV